MMYLCFNHCPVAPDSVRQVLHLFVKVNLLVSARRTMLLLLSTIKFHAFDGHSALIINTICDKFVTETK
jgi:hypothetical protein